MNKVQNKTMVRLLVAMLLLSGVSQSVKADTVDNYQVYLRDSLVRNERGGGIIRLKQRDLGAMLTVQYNHCSPYDGKRTLLLKDSWGTIVVKKVLPENSNARLQLRVGEIVRQLPVNPRSGKLVYIEDQMEPEGIEVASVEVDMDTRLATGNKGWPGKFDGPVALVLFVAAVGVGIWRGIYLLEKHRNNGK